jgi:putative Mn2+ efflux pump MntP
MIHFIIFSLIISLVPFSVALSSSVYRCIVWKEAFRIALVFAIVQSAMVSLGWLLGSSVKGMLSEMFVPVAIMILFFIGIRMIIDSRRLGREQRTMAVENIKILFGFAFVSSINSALLGMGLGLLYPNLTNWAGIVFIMVFLFSILGIRAGKTGMTNLGKMAELLGGVGLLASAAIILLQYFKIV